MTTKTKANWMARPAIYLGEDLRMTADAFGEIHSLSLSDQVRAALPFWYAAVAEGEATIPVKVKAEKAPKPPKEPKAPKVKATKAEKAEKLAKPPKSEAKPLGAKKEKKAKASKPVKADKTAGLKFPKRAPKASAPAPVN